MKFRPISKDAWEPYCDWPVAGGFCNKPAVVITGEGPGMAIMLCEEHLAKLLAKLRDTEKPEERG